MAVLHAFTEHPPGPYENEGLNTIYHLLFGDQLDLYNEKYAQPREYPWSVLLAADPPLDDLQRMMEDSAVETRAKLLATNLLLAAHKKPARNELFGVVIEVPVENGLDVLAAYQDGTARYINYVGKIILWDTRTAKSNQLIEQLFQPSVQLVNRIGPWDEARRPFPTGGMARLTFLLADGLYFGEAPFPALYSDPAARAIIDAGIQLMSFLVDQAVP